MLKALVALFILLNSNAGFASGEVVTLVKAHHQLERSRTLVFANGQIYAGRTGTQSEAANFIEAYDGKNLQLTESIRLSHDVRKLQVVDDCTLMVMSSMAYSVVNICNSGPSIVRSFKFGLDFVPHVGAYDGGGKFIFSEPNAGMIKYSEDRSVQNMGKHISMAVSMNYWNDKIWITNYSSIHTVDPITGSKNQLVPTNDIYGFKYTREIPLTNGEKVIVATAREDKKIVLVDPIIEKIDNVLDIKSEPEGISSYGNCAVIASSSDKTVLFVKVVKNRLEIVDAWDANAAGDELKMPSEVAMDPISKTVFLRSTYPCMTCDHTQSSLYAMTKSPSNIETCLK
jgi:hypothetical protein